MTFQTALFYIFSAILVFAALRVVTSRNPVHAVLWLVLAFFTAAAHWLMLRAEFLAIVLVLRVRRRGDGALPVRRDDARHQFRQPAEADQELHPRRRDGRRAGAGRDGADAGRRPGGNAAPADAADAAPARQATPRRWAPSSTPEYVYPFEIAAVILLVAIIAAIALTHRTRRDSEVPEARRAGEGQGARSAARALDAFREAGALGDAFGTDAVALPRAGRDPVRDQHGRHLPQSQERHHPADGDRADAARGAT